MAGTKKKATKKYEKNHLKDTIDRRKEFAKIKQWHQVKAKKKARKGATGDPRASENDDLSSKRVKNGNDVSKISTDDFFENDFELPGGKLKANGKRKREAKSDEDHEDGVETGSSSGGSFGFVESDEDADDTRDQSKDQATHKGDLEALAENDPEFYKYLEENDAELLEFDDNAKVPDFDDLDDEQPRKRVKKGAEEDDDDAEADGTELTVELIHQWSTSMSEQHSLRAMRETVMAFKAAAYFNSEEVKLSKYKIPDANVYHSTLVTALQNVPLVLNHHLPPKEHASGKFRISTDSKKFRSLVPTLKTYTTSIHHLLESLSDAPTIKLTINALHPLIPYILSFNKLLRQILTTVTIIWSSTTTSDTDSATCITAFLLIRRLFVQSESSFRTAALKLVYLHLVKTSRTTNSHTLPTVNLLKNSAAELWSLDSGIGYTTAFTHIRQLAIHLRGSITKPTKESHKQIYNWQYVHSLDFWARVLCHNCALPQFNGKVSSAPLHPLIYPLVQLILGTIRLIPSPTYFPLHLHLIRTSLRISLTTKTYIPLAPHLLSILSSPEISKPPSNPSTLSPLSFSTVLRAPKSYLRTRTYQDGVSSQVQLLLTEFFVCWCTNIAFPELVVPPTIMLKRWLKSLTRLPSSTEPTNRAKNKSSAKKANKNPKIHALFTSLLQKLTQQAALVEKERERITFAPSDRAEVEAFMCDVDVNSTPLGAWVERLRERERDGIGAEAATAATADLER